MAHSSTAFFQGANNVQFGVPLSTTVGGNIVNNHLSGTYGSELQPLIERCVLGALVDSNEQYNAPQCEEETREVVVQQMDAWGRSRAGKSTLSQTLAMRFKREGLLVGSFFFSNRRPGRSNGNALILTLVLQLIIVFPALGPFILDEIKKNPMILSSSPEEHMQRLFINPLNSLQSTRFHLFRQYLIQSSFIVIFLFQLAVGPIFGDFFTGFGVLFASTTHIEPQPTLIVIDGLDECDDIALQTHLIHVISSALSQLHQPLRFLISSRPEAHIARAFEEDPALPIDQLHLSADRDAIQDIERYLRRRFALIRKRHPFGGQLPNDWPSDKIIERLVLESSGHFIYPSTILTFVDDPNDFPDQRLEGVFPRTTLLRPSMRSTATFFPASTELTYHLCSAFSGFSILTVRKR
ncbi:hypothetical protein CPB83DRAFT_836457 [Crepidotus variabilis]|uniref:Nephrocystin 3-like N-terminal domain-containing protein n=1 Tax=Crepidotus variabilis TaxID=179855 RepID=A0A9P6JP13_9AGAR|nr:hypothetical protein CPB83DRAFT_836457 [Crepidotus variabilis]